MSTIIFCRPDIDAPEGIGRSRELLTELSQACQHRLNIARRDDAAVVHFFPHASLGRKWQIQCAAWNREPVLHDLDDLVTLAQSQFKRTPNCTSMDVTICGMLSTEYFRRMSDAAYGAGFRLRPHLDAFMFADRFVRPDCELVVPLNG